MPRTMPPEILDAAIRWLVSSRLDHPRLTLYGGEPLLAAPLIRRALDRVRKWAPRRMKPDVRIVTNGIRLDEEMARLLVGRDVFITISHDGVLPAQDDRGPGTYEVLDRLLVRLGRDYPKHFRTRLAVKMTLTSRNVRYLADSFRYFLSRGVRQVGVAAVLPDDPGWSVGCSRQLSRQLAEIAGISTDEFRRTGEIPFLPFRGGFGEESSDDGPVCACGSRGLLFVDVSGALAPCVGLAPSILGSQPKTIRNVARMLGCLRVTDRDLPAALLRRESRARRSRFLNVRPKVSALDRCYRCPARSRCLPPSRRRRYQRRPHAGNRVRREPSFRPASG